MWYSAFEIVSGSKRILLQAICRHKKSESWHLPQSANCGRCCFLITGSPQKQPACEVAVKKAIKRGELPFLQLTSAQLTPRTVLRSGDCGSYNLAPCKLGLAGTNASFRASWLMNLQEILKNPCPPHNPHPQSANSPYRKARAKAQRRLAVAKDTPSSRAASLVETPTKYRSFTS